MRQRRIRWLAFTVIAAVVLGWTLFVVSRPDSEMLSYMADDAFYYLVPAVSFAQGHGWSHDHVTRTSGFQPLYGYGSAVAAVVTGDTRALPIVMTLSSAVTLLFGVWALLKRTEQLYGAAIAGAGIALTLAAPLAFVQITRGLEWGWAVMMTALVVSVLTRARGSSVWAVGAAAFFTTLVRVDLSVFVAIFALTVAWSRWHADAGTRNVGILQCVVSAAGAGAALLITAANSWAITGRWVPNSVAMKEFWSRSNDFQPAISWDTLVSCTGPGAVLTSLRAALGLRSFIVIGLFFACAALVSLHEWRKGPERRALAIASPAALVAYTVAYARGVNLISGHYSASIIVPMALIMCGALAALPRYWPAVASGLAVGAAVVSVNGSWGGDPAILVIARHAGDLFGRLPSGARVAAWNAGTVGWRTGGHVINLDGLANASVVPSLESGQLSCYLLENRIDHIMDYGMMFPGQIDTHFGNDEESRRKLHRDRNGYDSATLYRCVNLEATANDDTFPSSRYMLFGVNSNCLAELCRSDRARVVLPQH